MANVPEARDKLKMVVEQGIGKLIIDLSEVTIIDSSGLSVLISALKAIQLKEGRMALVRLSPVVQSLIELTRLHHVFEIFLTTEAAIEAIQK